MSINTNIKTPHKKEIAELLRSLANMVQKSSNETITLVLELTFDKTIEKGE